MSSKGQSIVESMTSWYGLNFRSARVPDLPRRLSLGSDSPDLYELDYAGEADEKVCWKLMHSCRERGDNVAVNQLDTEEKLRFQLRFSVSFTIRKAKNPRSKSDHVKEQNVEKDVKHGEYLNALIVINPSIYARTVDTCLAHIHIYRSETLSRDQSVYDDLLSLALTLIPQLDLGYTRCIANVAAGLSNLVESHRRAGFLVVATIPRGIKLVGLGSSDDLVMVKPIFHGHRPRRSSEDIALLCKLYAEEASDVIESLSGADGMLRAPFLPRPYVFENGLEVIVRNVKFSESELAYDVWKTAAGKGQGYGLDECPTLEMFQLIMMTDHYCIAFDDAQTSQLVGLTFISDSWYHRNPDLKYGETSLFLTEPYRGRGIGPEATHLGLLLLKQLGYTATLNDTLLSNSQMFKALKRSPLPPLAVGVIPDSTYTAGRGWDDQVILLADYSESNLVHGFVEASENSLKRKYTSSKL